MDVRKICSVKKEGTKENILRFKGSQICVNICVKNQISDNIKKSTFFKYETKYIKSIFQI